MSDQTLLTLFQGQVERGGDKPALHFRIGDDFHSLSWNALHSEVMRVAAGLIEIGVQPGDRVATISENRPEWIIADFAIQFAQAVHTPLHAQLSAAQMAEQLNHSGAKVVFAADAALCETLAKQSGVSSVKNWFAFNEGHHQSQDSNIAPFKNLGAAATSEDQQRVADAAMATISPQSLATIIYTSGTTGEPRGVMLSQANLVTNATAVLAYYPQYENDVRLCFLPLSHVFARTCDLYTWLLRGSQLALAKSRETVADDCRQWRPHVISGVPYFFEKVQRRLIEAGVGDNPSAISFALGDRLRFCGSGGAALPDDVYDFFASKGTPILQGYGLTETSPVISATPLGESRRGSVGKAIPGVEIRIADDGEILTRGPHVMQGYYRNAEATAAAIQDGWLHTGDLGHLDDDGYLFITGRRKEMLVTSTGKNVIPTYCESILQRDPLIEHAMVLGDGKKRLAALIVVDLTVLNQRIDDGEPIANLNEANENPHARSIVLQSLNAASANLARHEQIGEFALLPQRLSIENGELTAKLTLRRDVISQRFAEVISLLFQDN